MQPKNAIQVSGGIDSLALLFHLRALWDDSIVMWGDTGAAYDDVIDLMDRIRRMVPHFLCVRSEQPELIAEWGHPVDVVPVSHTRLGELIFGKQPIVFQSYLDCCARARFQPLERAVRECGVQVVYRGARNDEHRRARIEHGQKNAAGVTHLFPLRDWSRERVFEYMRRTAPDFIPAYYAQGEKTSRDCWSCTAYRDDNVARVEHLPQPRRELVESILDQWQAIVQAEMQGV
jgi:3'-phosphoadenosine 5'-phosphosulfate sulfotransferase (PAPS reductase)/FAD synthetase